MSDDDSLVSEFEFRRDFMRTASDPNGNRVISPEQQNVLNDLRLHLCREDLIYLDTHKEVNI